MEEILVFKTNASKSRSLALLGSFLNNAAGIKAWNFDFDDCDNIFRLVSIGMTSSEVIKILSAFDIEAAELL